MGKSFIWEMPQIRATTLSQGGQLRRQSYCFNWQTLDFQNLVSSWCMHFDPLIEDKLFNSALSDTTKIDLPLRDLMDKTLNLKEKDIYMVTKRIFAWEIQDTVYFFFCVQRNFQGFIHFHWQINSPRFWKQKTIWQFLLQNINPSLLEYFMRI